MQRSDPDSVGVARSDDVSRHGASFHQRRARHYQLAEGELSSDLHERLDKLPSSTILHIPVSLRARAGAIMAACLEKMREGSEFGSHLERARSKLLFGKIPYGCSIRNELAQRMDLWDAGLFGELLIRAEEQYATRLFEQRRRRRIASQGNGVRARQLAIEGAYRKAVVSLTSSLAELSTDEQRKWTDKLLPRSVRNHPYSRTASEENAQDHREDEDKKQGYSLRGVRFAAMSAPGPSGARPEHLRDMISCRMRRIVSRLLKAIGNLQDSAANGRLSSSCRWILDSRLVFLKKKKGPAPRPVRVGELWRRVIAKRLVHDHRQIVQQLCLRFRQFGVALPGGADILIHARSLIEDLIRDRDQLLAILDLDLKNAFPSFEWKSIREALAEFIPSLLPWTSWCHAGPSTIFLPGGGRSFSNRGAEQVDPLGSIY